MANTSRIFDKIKEEPIFHRNDIREDKKTFPVRTYLEREDDKPEEEQTEWFDINKGSMSFKSNRGNYDGVMVSSSKEWSASTKANWVVLTPSHADSGNTKLFVTTTKKNNGRIPHVDTVKISNGKENYDLKITQEASDSFISAPYVITNIPNTENTFTVSGLSNENGLYFRTNSTIKGSKVSNKFKVNNIVCYNQSATTNVYSDIGSNDEFTWEIDFTMPKNLVQSSRTESFEVIGFDGKSSLIRVVQDAGVKKPELTTKYESLMIGYQVGSTNSLQITSNSNWFIINNETNDD